MVHRPNIAVHRERLSRLAVGPTRGRRVGSVLVRMLDPRERPMWDTLLQADDRLQISSEERGFMAVAKVIEIMSASSESFVLESEPERAVERWW